MSVYVARPLAVYLMTIFPIGTHHTAQPLGKPAQPLGKPAYNIMANSLAWRQHLAQPAKVHQMVRQLSRVEKRYPEGRTQIGTRSSGCPHICARSPVACDQT